MFEPKPTNSQTVTDGNNPALPGFGVRMRTHKPAIIFLTGLSGSGKPTLAAALNGHLVEREILPTVVDGDVLRAGLSSTLVFSDDDRRENIRRATELALHLADVG